MASQPAVQGGKREAEAVMYEKVTHGVRVSVRPEFIDDQSDADAGRYLWAYTIDIVNEGEVPVRLRTRYWRITDESGRIEDVSGPGVVGETPYLKPGAKFTYTSSCPLTTPSGIMVGNYRMVTDDNEVLIIDIPAFSLDSPYARRTMN